jgi:hypothetical protein
MNSIEDNNPDSGVQSLIRNILDEVMSSQQKQAEPAYKRELNEERSKRELLEKRLNEVINENQKTKAAAEALERESRIKAELQRHGVVKLDLAYRAVKDDVQRDSDGTLMARAAEGHVPLKDFVKLFLDDNPELLPARNTAGSGAQNPGRAKTNSSSFDLDSIHPGMSREEMTRARQEIARIASQITE